MPTPDEIEAAAGIEPADELERKRIWAAAQYLAGSEGRAPSAEDLRRAEGALDAAHLASAEHLTAGRGRATITLTDAGMADEIDITVELVPEPEDIGNGEVAPTPAQIIALNIVHDVFGGEETG